MSVIFGGSFGDIVVLDIDDVYPQSIWNGYIEDKARRISDRFELGDCLIVLSSYHTKGDCLDWSGVNYHLVYDRIVPWLRVFQIIVQLAKEGKIDKRLAKMNMMRGDFTTRFTEKTPGGFVPFPIGYARNGRPKEGYTGGGIKKWLSQWKIARKISSKSRQFENPARIARETPEIS